MEEKLKKLLTLVKEVCDDHRQYKKGFNVITTFVKPHREVELHSRFITWLLDPKAPHGLSTLPLELFLKQLNSQFKVSKEKNKTEVVPNASNWTEDREMDILIKGLVNEKREESAIIIENKIYAKDSDKGEHNGQLARYLLQVETGRKVENRHLIDSDEDKNEYYSCKNKNIELFYLTLDGHEPIRKDFQPLPDVKGQIPEGARTVKIHEGKNYEEFRRITYLRDIEPWLNEIILNIYNCEEYSQTIEIIHQYLDALHCVSPNIKLNQDLFAAIENNESMIKTLKKFLEDKDHNDWIKLPPEKIEENLEKEERDEYKIEAPLWATAIFLLKNHKHLYWHALNDFFIKLQDELHVIFGDNLLPREEDQKNAGKEKTIDRYVSEIIFEEKNASKLSPMYYRIRLKNGEEWTLQPNRAKGFFLGLDKKQTTNDSEAVGWETEIYLDKEGHLPLLNLWDFTQGDTFDLLNEQKRKGIAHHYAQFVKNELNKLK